MRSVDGIPLRPRWASNPGGAGEAWVLRRFAPWLYQPGYYLDEYEGPYAKPGERCWFVRLDGEDVLVTPDDELECGACGAVWCATKPPPKPVDAACDHPRARDRVFFPGLLEDNPYLWEDGEYLANLQQADPLTYAQLRHGDWMMRAAPGIFFRQEFFPADTPPVRTAFEAFVRYWDQAATEPDEKNPEPDWTVGELLGRDRDGLIWVLDEVRERVEPHAVNKLILETAKADAKRWGKRRVTIGIEQEPGASGKKDAAYLTKMLQGYPVQVERPTGDKVTRARPWSAQCAHGNVRLAKAPWNRGYRDEHVKFPGGAFDDRVDASSGGFGVLMNVVRKGRAKTKGKRRYANAPGGY